MDLPRAPRDLTSRPYFVYRSVTARPATYWLGMDDGVIPEPDLSIETQVIDSARSAAIAETEVFTSLADAAEHARVWAVDRLASELRRRERVVEKSAEPRVEYRVVAHVWIDSWPIVAGITGPDWDLLDEEFQAVAWGAAPFELIASMHNAAVLTQVESPHQIILAANPDTRVPEPIAEYFRVVRDDRVPLGILRLARSIR